MLVAMLTLAGCGPRAATPVPARAAAPGDEIVAHDVRPSTNAKDDLPHLRARLAWLDRVGDCIPVDEDLLLALDAYDGKLVACAQVITRRGASVFFDPVSYACWNVDPATGAVAKRRDRGRDYFRCQDGACTAGATAHVSHDGAHELIVSDGKLAIVRRPGGAPVRELAFPTEDPMRGDLTLVGSSLIYVDRANAAVNVHDDRGALRTTLAGLSVHVVDDTHILASGMDGDHILYDLVSGQRTVVARGADYLEAMVRFGGAYYAVDGDARAIVALDPASLQPRHAQPLRTCPLSP